MSAATKLSPLTLDEAKTDAICIALTEEHVKKLPTLISNKTIQGFIKQALADTPSFKGKAGESITLPTYGNITSKCIILVGIGKGSDLKAQSIRKAAASAVRKAQTSFYSSITFNADTLGTLSSSQSIQLLAEGALLANYKFLKRKSSTKNDSLKVKPLASIQLAISGKITAADKQALKQAEALAIATHQTRDLVFDAPNHVKPSTLATAAQKLAKTYTNIKCKVLTEAEMKKLGMGSLLSVAQGSVEPPKLIHLTYTPSTKKAKLKKVCLVGKGITFDSGGLSLKPAKSMELMKDDMAGAAVVLNTIEAVAKLGLFEAQLDVIIPTCENMPSGTATRPGDVVTAMNGTTIEINNTDAEGRLILCDALCYAQKTVKPDEIIDLATLTGAVIMALGKNCSGIMGTSDSLINAIKQAGETAGEQFWPLPLFDDYKRFLNSDIADIINAGSGGEAGSSAGGIFLKHFIEDGQAWAHLDIAGTAWADRDQPETPKGATGVAVRTLLYYLHQWS